MMASSKEIIGDLIDGKLDWNRVKSLISGYKEEDRFAKYLAVLSERVPWTERILLPLTEDLFIVEKGGERIVKCRCGHEYGDYRKNWKLEALIHVRETEEEIQELYPYPSRPDPQYCEIREFYCPTCGTQLEVETVPYGYPLVFDFLPDLDTFYREWLNQPLKDEKEFKDLTYDAVKGWSA
ncbi:MAG: acetone carboxylase subunit gamma [Candidatus Tectomicrobia bacterium]|uniref:Acetone carboxylase subunit gamma n=1 Tax=Tectimicrobiota bacterium TaxID=2528274 RepID=A0A932FYU5_UNCTE|nr:acetone carboxylase subunit gamma [Candidatus Tectomicrobia bacterium]